MKDIHDILICTILCAVVCRLDAGMHLCAPTMKDWQGGPRIVKLFEVIIKSCDDPLKILDETSYFRARHKIRALEMVT